ncbi:hypothetical protein JCM10207_007958 [Rhodosporidiobolus poonsookiae]
MAWLPFAWGSVAPSTSPPASPPSRPSPTISAAEGGGGATDPDSDEGVEVQTALASWTAMLAPFAGGALPEKARTNPQVRQRLEQPMTLARMWEYLPFVAKQSTSLTKAFVQHHLFGPPKPSWGVELTLFTTFLREVSSYSHLSSLARLRSVLELGSLLPAPKDGIVTPISFRVRRRGLRGILAKYDEQETGNREIAGEWVTNKRLWRKMTREWSINKAKEAAAPSTPLPSEGGKGKEGGSKDGLVCLYLHGGAYYMFSAETHRYLTISVSRYCEARVFAINYRLAPETRFPGQLHDAVSAYMRLTEDLRIPPENIIFAGDSAGGGLCLATLMYLRDNNYPLPSGAILMSPWCDLTMSCQSWETNRPFDYLPNPNSEDDHLHPVKCLLGEDIEQYLTHPYVSPLFGDYTDLPPLLVQAGDAEVLRDEITLMAHKAALAGVKVEHEIFEDCVHVFQAFLFLEASRKAFQSQRHFIKHTLPRLRRKMGSTSTSHAPSPISTSSSEQLTPTSDFDFSEVDREVVADAHEVDQHGRAEAESLPPTPQSASGRKPLPDVQQDSSASSDEDELDSDERLSDSTASPAQASPYLDEADTPTRSEFPSLSLATDPASLPSFSTALTATPTSTSSSPTTQTSASKLPRRPILRTYASARDFSMSMLRSGSSTSSASSDALAQSTPSLPLPLSTPTSPISSRKRRSLTLTTSQPTSPRLGLAARPLAPADQRARSQTLHARTASHPEFEALLRSCRAEGDGKGLPKTRVWSSQVQGGAPEKEVE